MFMQVRIESRYDIGTILPRGAVSDNIHVVGQVNDDSETIEDARGRPETLAET